jgi:hypothetical protein
MKTYMQGSIGALLVLLLGPTIEHEADRDTTINEYISVVGDFHNNHKRNLACRYNDSSHGHR